MFGNIVSLGARPREVGSAGQPPVVERLVVELFMTEIFAERISTAEQHRCVGSDRRGYQCNYRHMRRASAPAWEEDCGNLPLASFSWEAAGSYWASYPSLHKHLYGLRERGGVPKLS
ncbi:jg26611 [Pararge aegeria aegeria]|uniref:Jg26611 protein n=1 Tax=Pararge aegeria aegeria TaxID=348720 RepID=A0A8S4QTD9_9NEOP|nr:jg26611 [Pararge aegeria aegeria]